MIASFTIMWQDARCKCSTAHKSASLYHAILTHWFSVRVSEHHTYALIADENLSDVRVPNSRDIDPIIVAKLRTPDTRSLWIKKRATQWISAFASQNG